MKVRDELKELRGLKIAQLQKQIQETQREIEQIRIAIAFNKEKSPVRLKAEKKKLARLWTLLIEKVQEQGEE